MMSTLYLVLKYSPIFTTIEINKKKSTTNKTRSREQHTQANTERTEHVLHRQRQDRVWATRRSKRTQLKRVCAYDDDDDDDDVQSSESAREAANPSSKAYHHQPWWYSNRGPANVRLLCSPNDPTTPRTAPCARHEAVNWRRSHRERKKRDLCKRRNETKQTTTTNPPTGIILGPGQSGFPILTPEELLFSASRCTG